MRFLIGVVCAVAGVSGFFASAAEVDVDQAVVEPGAVLTLRPHIDFGKEEFRAYSIFGYLKNMAPGIESAAAERGWTVQENGGKEWRSVTLAKYVFAKEMPAEVKFDTTGLPSGDYTLGFSCYTKLDGKDLYKSHAFSFAIRDRTRGTPSVAGGPDADGVLQVPRLIGFAGDPDGIARTAVPWQGGFHRLESGEAASPQTKFKMFHDGDWLYVAVACEESPEGMARLAKLPRLAHDAPAICLENAVEINLDPTGRGLGFYKIAVRPTGDVSDMRAEDDNTGTERFAFDRRWESGARVKVTQAKKTWLAEFAIPLGPLTGSAEDCARDWSVLIGRLVGGGIGRPVVTSAWPKGATTFTKPREFAHLRLDGYAPKTHDWSVVAERFTVSAGTDGQTVDVAGSVVNRTDAYRLYSVDVSLTDINGKTIAKTETGLRGIAKGRPDAFHVKLTGVRKGPAALHLDVRSAEGRLERQLVRDVKVEYEPVKINLTKPCYRDCIFDSMKLDRIEGEVVLEAGVGKPLEIKLTGEGTSERLRIPSAAVTNRFTFPFAGKAKGDYFIAANGVKKRVRNLPFHPGEIWFDATGVIYREGRKFMPWGYFSDIFTDPDPTLTIAQQYHSKNGSADSIRAMCAESGRFRRGFILSPCQALGTNGKDLFDYAGQRGEFTEAQKAELKAFVDVISGEPWFLAHYMSDEPEGKHLNPEWFRAAREYMTEIDPYHPTIMLNYSIAGAIRFAEGGDINCPDAYPVYLTDGTTRDPRRITYDKAKAASASAQAKFAGWITPQLFDWASRVNGKVTCGPDYDQLREQALLALAGDARGFLWYSRWTSGSETTEHLRLGPINLHKEIAESEDVFLSPTREGELTVRATGPAKTFISALKRFGKETLVIAVNTSGEEVEATFSGKGLPQKLYANGEGEPIAVRSGRFTGRFRPYEARVYYDRVKRFGHTANRKEVYDAEAARRTPGNLAVAPKFVSWEVMVDMEKQGLPAEWYPRVVASSSFTRSERRPYAPYFLQDGIHPERPYCLFYSWMPDWSDNNPWVRVEFGSPKRFNRVVLHRPRFKTGGLGLKSGSVTVNGKKVAEFNDAESSKVVLDFPEVESDAVTVNVWEVNRKELMGCLTEIEVFRK